MFAIEMGNGSSYKFLKIFRKKFYIFQKPLLKKFSGKNFDTDLMHKNGIFIDGDVITELESNHKNNSFYFLGNAKGNITVNKGRYNIYLYEKSNLDITVEGDAIVNIYVLAWSNLNVTGNGTKVVEVNHISKSAEIKSDGNVKIFDRIVIDKYIRAMWRKK